MSYNHYENRIKPLTQMLTVTDFEEIVAKHNPLDTIFSEKMQAGLAIIEDKDCYFIYNFAFERMHFKKLIGVYDTMAKAHAIMRRLHDTEACYYQN